MADDWYRAWRNEDRDYFARFVTDADFRRREKAKRVMGQALIMTAIVAGAWRMVLG